MKPFKRQLSAAFLILAATSIAADWPQYRGPNRDGVSRETGLLKAWPPAGPKLLWTYSAAGSGLSGPVIVGDKLYLTGGRDNSEHLFAIDLKAAASGTVKELWSTRIGPLFTWEGNTWNIGPNVAPTVDGELVFALGGFGDLICAETATGKEVWRVNLPRDLGGEVNPIGGGLEEPTPLGWGYASAPLVDGDKLICVPGGKKGLLAALDKKTGKVLWQSAEVTDQASYSSPLAIDVAGKKQYIQVTNKEMVGIAADTGKLLWSYKRPTPFNDVVTATPLFKDNCIFATVGFGEGCDLVKLTAAGEGITASLVYSNRDMQSRDGGVVLVGDNIYGYSEKGGWLCQDFKTGKVHWSEREALGRGSLTCADGLLYCCAEKGGAVVLVEPNEKGWKEISRCKLSQQSKHRPKSGGLWTHPVVANGKLYIRDQELLFCFDVGKK